MIFKEKLNLFDVTNLVIGAVVGADIYVATSFGMGKLGPLSLLVWFLAGIIAICFALSFVQCAKVVKAKIGGPYAYVRQAFGHFPGFVSGWALWLAELAGLCVFPLAFVHYLGVFVPMNFFIKTIAIFGFLSFLFLTNYFGIKKAASANDALTILKLGPLFLIIILGFAAMIFSPQKFFSNFLPIAPLGFNGFGEALILIFWAYVGFEIATIPANEIQNPEKTIPKAIVFGMIIITLFYVITNFAIIGMAGMQLANSDAPLALAGRIALGGIGALIIVIGALVSVSGSDESNTIGTSRLAVAMAVDGYFPRTIAKRHPIYYSPYVSLLLHSAIAFIATAFFSIKQLIIFSTFNFAITYLLVILAAFRLNKSKTMFERIILMASFALSLFLITRISTESLYFGILALLFGFFVYILVGRQKALTEEKEFLLSEERVLGRMIRHEETFLANVFKHIKIGIRRATGSRHVHSLRHREKNI